MILYHSYNILAPDAVPKGFAGEPKEAGSLLISQTGLDKDEYRIGHTKVGCLTFRLISQLYDSRCGRGEKTF